MEPCEIQLISHCPLGPGGVAGGDAINRNKNIYDAINRNTNIYDAINRNKNIYDAINRNKNIYMSYAKRFGKLLFRILSFLYYFV